MSATSMTANPIWAVPKLWGHRTLIRQLVVREIVGRYRGSWLGVLWSLFTPLIMLAIYTFEYFADFTVEATEVGFGMHVRTTEGIGLAGAQTIASRSLRTKRIEAGSRMHIQYEFSCTMLPGPYFLSAGAQGIVGGDHIVIHRIVDAVMICVAPEPELIAVGRADIGAQPRIRLLPAGQCPELN